MNHEYSHGNFYRSPSLAGTTIPAIITNSLIPHLPSTCLVPERLRHPHRYVYWQLCSLDLHGSPQTKRFISCLDFVCISRGKGAKYGLQSAPQYSRASLWTPIILTPHNGTSPYTCAYTRGRTMLCLIRYSQGIVRDARW